MVDYSNIPRDSRRVPLETRVQLKFDRFDGFISEYSSNLSPGGIFLRTRAPQALGTVLDFAFRLGDGFELIRGRGEVVWNRLEDEGPTRPAGMGLRFLELSEGSKDLIYRIVDQHILEGGTPYDVTQRPPDPLPVGPGIPPPAPPPVPPAAAPPAVSPAMTVLSALPDEEARETSPFALPDAPPAALAAAPLESPPIDQASGAWPRPAPPPSDVFELPPPPPPYGVPRTPEPPRALDEPEETPSWLPSPHEPPLGSSEPFPDLLSSVPHEAAPYEPAAYAPRPEEDAPAVAPPMFAATLGPGGARGAGVASRRRSRLPLVLIAAGVLLAAGLFLIRDQVMGWIGLGGDEEAAAPAKPAARPHRGPRAPRVAPPGAVSGAAVPATAAATPPATSGGEAREAATTAGIPAAPAPASPPLSAVQPSATPPAPQPAPKPAAPAPQAPAPAAPPLPEPVTRVKPAASAASAASAGADSGTPLTALEKITFEASAGGTDVILWGNGAFPASVYSQSRIDGNPPRELFRLSGIRQPFGEGRVRVGTPEVLQVRTGFHAGAHGGNELHVVLDLAHPNAVVTQVEAGPKRLKIHLQRR